MSDGLDFKDSVKLYWENPDTISIIDKNLHKIEIDTVCKYLSRSTYLADIGCGNAGATIEYAKKVHKCIGFERSDTLRKKALDNILSSGLTNISIKYGDILEMDALTEKFDVIVTQRLLINLASWDEQKQAILNVHNALKPGGCYIMIENTNDAFLALNDMRAAIGLDPIPQHWHNRFFDYDMLMNFFDGKFQVLRVHDFGLYYLLTRVYVQMFSSFVGYGKDSVKDPIFERSDEAARIIFEKFSDRFHISGCRVLGPIQAFILRREA